MTCNDCVHYGLCDCGCGFGVCRNFKDKKLFVKIACEVGTKVWYVFGREIYECEVVEIDVFHGGRLSYTVRNADFSIKENRPATIFHSLGEGAFKLSCFFTKEEAEQKLKEIENGS